MSPSPLSPIPVSRHDPNEPGIITTHCKKCGNEIKTALGDLTRAQALEKLSALDQQIGECPGGFHVEFGGWSRLWDLERAINEHFDAKEKATP
jgi:hypothetical protein